MTMWKSVKDGLPEKDGRYLVVEVYSYYPWVGVCSLREGKWDSPSIKYWQELPEFPKELEFLKEFQRRFLEKQQLSDPEFEKFYRDNFWDLLA